jgi:uncharacterized protein YqjF (DUF2071 family)
VQGPPVFSVTVKNFALITYSVPAERIRMHLPTDYELETFQGQDGLRGFVSTTCFCNQDYRPRGINIPRHTFNESTYRTYVTHKGRKGVYFFGRYLGTRVAWLCQRPVTRHVYNADFTISTDKERRSNYSSYVCDAASEAGVTSFSLKALEVPRAQPPFPSADALVQFLTYRLHGFYTDSLGAQGHMPVQHPRMTAVAGQLSTGRFGLWEELGIVTEEEAVDPYSVLVIPEVPFRLYAPRFLG